VTQIRFKDAPNQQHFAGAYDQDPNRNLRILIMHPTAHRTGQPLFAQDQLLFKRGAAARAKTKILVMMQLRPSQENGCNTSQDSDDTGNDHERNDGEICAALTLTLCLVGWRIDPFTLALFLG